MSKLLKSYMVDEYKTAFDGVESCVLVDVSALKVDEVQDFRNHLRDQNIGLRVIRNRLAFHAVEGSALEPVRTMFSGQTAIAYSPEDKEGISTAKAVIDFKSKHKKLPIAVKGGLSEGAALAEPDVEALSKVPDRPQLQAMAMGAILGSARGLAVSLNGVAAGLARCLQAKVDKGEG